MSTYYLSERRFSEYLASLPGAPLPPEPWDGRSCQPCHGAGTLYCGDPAFVLSAPCPWCDGTGKTPAEQAELAALERMWR